MTEYADILRLCGGALLASVCIVVLRGCDRAGMGGVVSACFSVILAAAAVGAAVPFLAKLRDLTEPYLQSEYADILWRALACGMTVELTSDVIRDAGESSLADKVEFAGRAVLLSIGFPLYEAVFSLAGRLLGL